MDPGNSSEDDPSINAVSLDEFKSKTLGKWPTTVPPVLHQRKRIPVPKLLCQRSYGMTSRNTIHSQCQYTKSNIGRLQSTQLKGHDGCVNCIEFSSDGSTLVSGSDDYKLILWDVSKRKQINTYTTTHGGNIFTAKFLGSNLLVSGAADRRVEVHDIETEKLLHSCHCHYMRVKRIATSPLLSHTFFSAAEDGNVIEYDVRTPHVCNDSPACCVVDIKLHNFESSSTGNEAKCVALNPMQPHYIAVGSNDPYVRVYDRRKIIKKELPINGLLIGVGISVGETGSTSLLDGCVQYYVPGHFLMNAKELNKKYGSLSTTYLSYSRDGRYLLANLGGENVYLYDTHQHTSPVKFTPPSELPSKKHQKEGEASCTSYLQNQRSGLKRHKNGHTSPTKPSSHILSHSPHRENTFSSLSPLYSELVSSSPPLKLPPRVEELNEEAKSNMRSKMYETAVKRFNDALELCHNSPELIINLSCALCHRCYEGDYYSALRLTFRALYYDPTYVRAYVWMMESLFNLDRFDEALKCLEEFQSLYPNYVTQPGDPFRMSEFRTKIQSIRETKATPSTRLVEESMFDENPILLMCAKRENVWRENTCDYLASYSGHCNTTTDIKEAVFLGDSCGYVAAGSDDGNLFIWDTITGNIVRVLAADENIVNCVQSHPTSCLVATSGIEDTVKLWEPMDDLSVASDVQINSTARQNHRRMNADPLEVLFMQMGELNQVFNRAGVPDVMFREDEAQSDDDDEFPMHDYELLRLNLRHNRRDSNSNPPGGDACRSM